MSLFGLGSKSSNNASWIDPVDKQRQLNNYAGAQGLQANYAPTSSAQISSYLNPYQDTAIKGALGDLDYQRQLAVHQGGDQAASQHAFGGSRQGVADALTNEAFARQGGLLSSQMQNQGFWNAANMAQGENQYGYQYPLARQGLLNQTLGGITNNTFGKRTDKDPAAAFKNFGSLLNTGGDIAKFIASLG